MTQLEELPGRMDRLESQIVQLRTEMRDEFSAVRTEFAAVRTEMRTGDEETRRYMRVLFEEYVGRMRVIGEPGPTKRPRSSRKKSGA